MNVIRVVFIGIFSILTAIAFQNAAAYFPASQPFATLTGFAALIMSYVILTVLCEKYNFIN